MNRLMSGVVLTLLVTLPVLAHAQTQRAIAVDPLSDPDAANGCTLREAISLANASAVSALGCTAIATGSGVPIRYVIELPAYTYTLAGDDGDDDNVSGDLDVVSADVSISGAGVNETILDANGVDRILHMVLPGATVSLSDMTLRNGKVTWLGTEPTDEGGAIYNNTGSLTISRVLFANNTAGEAASSSYGGAIQNYAGVLTITESAFIDNVSAQLGGAISSFGGVSIGADRVTIVNSELRGNQALSGGGAIYLVSSNGTAVISGSLIAANRATGQYSGGGGILTQRYGSDNTRSTTSIIDSAIIANTAVWGGGGIRAQSKLNIANSSLLANQTKGNGGGLSGAWELFLTHVTVAGNVADSDNLDGGDGGGLHIDDGSLRIQGTIVAGNSDLSGGGPDCFGSISSGQFNALGVNSGCAPTFTAGSPNANNDFVGTLPIPLDLELPTASADTQYLMPPSTSIAVDRVDAANCKFYSTGVNPLYATGDPVLTDQLGTSRDSLCDIGAVEFTEQIFSDGFEAP